ncbi:flagellar assembly protein FliW [Fictibacillus nanhaiensis]|uniref:flagellar assembly protein FliW n=1 Tax=Fictibacillus nanhaiensis TaxID=742169 RepID=UPI001C941BD8|nr:flagellar assembly protein FliW [Fictibacillus nanhaiensis]MBY6037058.1 flagellar assembly protein FliW [Fictibacillus nanhaiensis]
MKLQTKFQDTVEINESDILHFEQGLPGFEEETQFILMPMDGTPFSILQSATTPELAFVTADPFVFFKNYDFELSLTDQEHLQVNKASDVFVQVIVTVADIFEKSTANLQAPLIINREQNRGKQVVLTDSKYLSRHLLTENKLVGQEG